MSTAPRRIQWFKNCFMYCGVGRCDCGLSASPAQWEEHKAEQERQRAARKDAEAIGSDFDKKGRQ
jgi:hypothetical protein